VNHIRHQFIFHNGLYAPTYLHLSAEKISGQHSYKIKSTPYKINGKGKGIQLRDDQFEEERAWLLRKLKDEAEDDAKIAEQLDEKEYEDSGDGIECGCCFTAYPFVRS
jgi:E3 ubiquitin-protein ligase RNF216